MNTYLDCIPCFLKQALNAARAATDDEVQMKLVLDTLARLIPDIPLNQPPPETARLIYRTVREVTGVSDPFKAYKDESIKNALLLYEGLKSTVNSSEDPLHMAVKVAITGNVIDLGANPDYDLEKEMKSVLNGSLAVDHFQSFRQSLEKAETVLFLGDNAGETVFDRILIETMGKETLYTVRETPIINDATVEEAQKSGIGEVARIISSGCDTPGTLLKRCSQEFLDIFSSAQLIISKGQGNFESLSDEKAPIFFLFKVKCPVVSRHVGADEGEMILKNSIIPS